eukprot:CAMPEP_0119028886 /NCGR_PEP_ID=MMETSP1176-20130426/39742_1 /TAXON_ID=265551 /ORGANISM="Synedropsis recta cf, Strain CCMP1620" /LENGTH=342 /DNA_ID=CAMNT_0006985131 /DNA_START=53 /DNA_END=1084 /DNA_ORIENTATION=-
MSFMPSTTTTTTSTQYEFPARPPMNKLAFRPLSPSDIRVISHGATCPCCQRQAVDGRETLNEPPTCSRRQFYDQQQEAQACIAAASLVDTADKENSDSSEPDEQDFNEERDSQPGVLDSGVEYKPKRVLAEGIIHKKGTGKDWFGSRSWKPRYCRLVLAKVQGFAVEVPLLLVYWFHLSEVPSTVISLDSTVIVPLDQPEKDHALHCFSIIYAKDEEKATRTFSVAQKGRDAWVSTINQALYNYEKEKSKVQKAEKAAATALSKAVAKAAAGPIKTPGIYSGDSFVEMTVSSPRSTLCLPLSPRSSKHQSSPVPKVIGILALPRPTVDVAADLDDLVGECFL